MKSIFKFSFKTVFSTFLKSLKASIFYGMILWVLPLFCQSPNSETQTVPIRQGLYFGYHNVFEHQKIEKVKLAIGWRDGKDEYWQKPSVETTLRPGYRIDAPDFGMPGQWLIQRLSDRGYYMKANGFSSQVFVGDKGVLLADASSSLVPKDFLKAISRFTDLPLTTLVYSHGHTDHNGGAERLLRTMEEKGIELRIVASERVAKAIADHNNNVEPPNEVIPNGRTTFKFEKWDIVIGTPVGTAHSPGDSYILFPDGVIMYVDFNYPGRVPLAYLSSSMNITEWVNFMRHILGEEWTYANLGHANVGYKKDIIMTFEYLDDLYTSFFKDVLPTFEASIKNVVRTEGPSLTSGVYWGNYVVEASKIMAEKVYPKWKEVPQIEVIRTHAYKVFEDAFLNYSLDGKSRPKFTPIFPDTKDVESLKSR